MKSASGVFPSFLAGGLLSKLLIVMAFSGCSTLVTEQQVMLTLPSATIQQGENGLTMDYHYVSLQSGKEEHIKMEVKPPQTTAAGKALRILGGVVGAVALGR